MPSNSEKDRIQQTIDAFSTRLLSWVELAELRVEMDGAKFASPIERVMFSALYFMQLHEYIDGVQLENRPVVCAGPMARRAIEDELLGYFLLAQVPIGPYRADFAVWLPECGIRVVIECDGHDFHEKTKEQAARDKKRDRYVQACGWTVLRFTGSEIWRDPVSCAQQVAECVDSLYWLRYEAAE